MRLFRQFAVGILFLVLFSGIAQGQTRVSPNVPDTVQVEKGLEYARYGERVLKLDLYRPVNTDSSIPVVVVVAGGGYERVGSEATLAEAVAMAKRGIAAAAIEYRGPSELQFPATVHDIKAAVRWAKANAQLYNLDPEAVGVMGGSFGGQLATYVAVTAGIEELEGEGGNGDFSSDVYAAVGFSALTDLGELPGNTQGIVKDFLGGWEFFHRKKWRFASPITHVGPNSAPLMLMAAEKDVGVPPSQSISMARAYEEAGAEVKLEILPDAIHPFWIFDPWHDQVMDAAANFFIQHASQKQ
jgi:arylsulfatase A